ncbi:MAG: tetratricopeptide repeat protein [Desulfovibrionaceae bacterium]|nr:tetratricopeptide repeat protein [Desulfovibrionaceae bacterium]
MRLLLAAILLSFGFCLGAGCSEQKAEESYLTEARAAFGNKEFLEAEKLYERYLRQIPEGDDRWEAWERVAYIAINIRRDEGLATDIYEAMALEYGDRPEKFQDVMMRLAEIYEMNFRWQRAHSAWKRLLATPDLHLERKVSAHLHLSHIYQRGEDYVNALFHLEECLKLELPPAIRAQVLYMLSTVYANQGEVKAAEERLLELSTMSGAPNNIQVQGLFMLADLMEEQGKLKEALELFRSIENTYPNVQAVQVRIKALTEIKR